MGLVRVMHIFENFKSDIMATKLESRLVRETTEKVGDREILIALTPEQQIKMRLKGMKSGAVSIDIISLYEQLTGTERKQPKPVSIKHAPKKVDDDPMVSLYRLRSMNLTTPGKLELVTRIDELIVDLLEESKTPEHV